MLEQKLGKNNLFWFIDELAVAFSWAIVLGLILDFVLSMPNDPYGFGKWSWNIYYDFMYLRVGGPFLYGNHVLTGLYILSVPIIFSLKQGYKKMPLWLCLCFATVFIHEISGQVFSSFVYGWDLVGHQLISYYMLLLFLFTITAFKFANSDQRLRLKYIIIVSCISMGIVQLCYGLFDYKPLTLAQFAPGPQIYSFLPNLIENVLWILPVSIWYIPRKWLRWEF